MGITPESFNAGQRSNHEALMQEFEDVRALTDPESKRRALERLWQRLKDEDEIVVSVNIKTSLSYLRRVPQDEQAELVNWELQKLIALVDEDLVKAYEYQVMINNALERI
jgi:hypothetical protein